MSIEGSLRFSQPPPLQKILSRPRLHERLEEAQERRLLVLYGKAGSGKSTLMAEYLACRAVSGTWCRLFPEDSTPASFLSKLESSVAVSGTAAGTALGAGPTRSDGQAGLDGVLTSLNRAGRPGWFVLENFQEVNSSAEVCATIDRLIAGLNGKVRIAVLSREYPNFAVADVLASRQMLLLEDAELAFTREEISELFDSIYRIALTPAELTEILEISEGWIAPLIHLGEALDGKPKDIRNRTLQHFLAAKQLPSLDQFFARSVNGGLPESTGELLATLSVFPALSVDLVSTVTGRPGQRVLEELTRRNLFVTPLDPQGQRFTLHPLFRKYLFRRFSSFPESRRRSVHRAAAEFFRSSGNHEAAAHHLRISRGFAEARKLLLQEAETLLGQGEYEKLHDLLESYPPDVRSREPLLLYYHTITTNLMQPLASRKTLNDLLRVFRKSGDVRREAKIYSVLLVNHLFYQGNRKAVAEVLSATESFLARYGTQIDHDVRLTLETLVSFARWWTTPDIDDAFEIALRAEETARRIHNEEVLVFAHLTLARVYLDRGDFLKSTEVLEETETLVGRNTALRQYEPLLRFYLGDTYFYLGELTMALDQIDQGLKHIFSRFAFSQHLKLNQVLYLLYIPEVEKAEAVLGSIREESMGENLYIRYYSIYLLYMLLAYRKNNRERAAFYCRRLMDPENEDLLKTDYPYSYVALAEVQMFLEWHELAERTLVSLLQEISEGTYPYPTATAHGLLGYLFTLTGRREEAAHHLRSAAETVARRGYTNLDVCNPVLLHNIAGSIARSGLTELGAFPRLTHMSASQIIDQSMVGLNLYTLGDFRIVVNGNELSWELLSRHKKVMDLLKLLIVHRPWGLAKEVLYDLFWPGYLKKSSRTNLNTIIYRLRRILGEETPYIFTDSETIRLNRELCRVDADDFRELVRRGGQEAVKGNMNAAVNSYLRAKGIYRGDFLEKDLYYDDISDEREALRATYLKLQVTLVKMLLDMGRCHQALEINKELLEVDRLCEPAYRLLMICCTLVGNRSELPRIYNRLEDRLMRSFKIEPDPRTVRLKNALLEGTSPSAELWQSETIV
jgi:ATP/maltotriose-dependent transcriptional regulator MalT/DNA-binding SARP family transcriptional activator